MPTTKRPRGSLTHDEVIDEALALVGTDGLDALTMRRLAERLGVNPMTLYLRFENKDDLLAALVGRRLTAVTAPTLDASVEDRLVAWTRSVRDQLVGLGDLLPVVRTGRHIADTMVDGTEAGLALLDEAGFHDDEAVAALRSLFWHAVGFAVLAPAVHAHAPQLLEGADLSPDRQPHLTRLAERFGEFDPDDLFDRTTHALVRGLIGPRPGRRPGAAHDTESTSTSTRRPR